MSECTCGHDVDEHGDGFGSGSCLIYPCECVAFEADEPALRAPGGQK